MSPVVESSLVVRTSRLFIAALQSSHFAEYCEIVCHESTGRFDEEFPKSQDQAKESFEESLERGPFTTDSWNEYGVFDPAGNLVGLLSHLDTICESGELQSRMGYHFHPAFQGRGYATEAVGGLLEALFGQGIRSVECVVHPANEPSVALLKRCGFALFGFDPAQNELIYILNPVSV